MKKDEEKEEKNKYYEEFLQICNEKFNKKFVDTYKSTIKEFLMVCRPKIEVETKDILLLVYYSFITANPYSRFKTVKFDFSKFYEDLEKLSHAKLKEEIKRLYSNE
jgi:hypothetical protein